MTTIAAISKEAFDAVAAAFSDGVIQTASMSYDIKGSYIEGLGKFELTPTTITGGRGSIGTAQAITNSFPAHTAGPDDTLIYLEGFTTVPKIGWKVTLGTKERTIKAVGDIVGVGTFFEVIAA